MKSYSAIYIRFEVEETQFIRLQHDKEALML